MTIVRDPQGRSFRIFVGLSFETAKHLFTGSQVNDYDSANYFVRRRRVKVMASFKRTSA
jgi:hypothetical protein